MGHCGSFWNFKKKSFFFFEIFQKNHFFQFFGDFFEKKIFFNFLWAFLAKTKHRMEKIVQTKKFSEYRILQKPHLECSEKLLKCLFSCSLSIHNFGSFSSETAFFCKYLFLYIFAYFQAQVESSLQFLKNLFFVNWKK